MSPRRSSLASTSSSSSEPKPVKQVRFSFPVTILEAPDYAAAPESPALASISCEDGTTSKRRRLARLLLLNGGISLPSITSSPTSDVSFPLFPIRSGFHAANGRCLARGSDSIGSRLMCAMKSPTIMGLGREGLEKGLDMDEEDDEEENAAVGAERGIGRIDEEEEEDDDGMAPLDASRSYHSWHIRWLETDEDAD